MSAHRSVQPGPGFNRNALGLREEITNSGARCRRGVTSGLGEPSPRDGLAQTHAVTTSKHQHKENPAKKFKKTNGQARCRRGQGSGESENREQKENLGGLRRRELSHLCRESPARRKGAEEPRGESRQKMTYRLQTAGESTGHAYTHPCQNTA